MNNVGLILEGGANRGIFTAGVLDFFQLHKLYFPYVISVSVGTCNAIDYISKQMGRTKSCMIPNGRNIPPINWRNLLQNGELINLNMVFNDYPNKLVPFDYKTFFSSNILSEYVVTNCNSGDAEYLSEKSNRKKIMTICKASCSMPYLSSFTYLDKIPYLDGGVADPIPIKHAMSLGYSKNVIILTKPLKFLKNNLRLIHFINVILYHNYPNLIKKLDNRIFRYNQTLAFIMKLEKQKRVFVIAPDNLMISRLENNALILENFYNYGFQTAKEKYDDLCRFINN